MNYLEKANKWKNYAGLDAKLKEELFAMDDIALKEAFTDDLAFGTGGLRGVLGVGTNRMNYYVVRKATLGFGRYLMKFPHALEKGVVISYDNRFYSKEFALDSAQVLSTLGFKVYLFTSLRPTPELSYAVRYYKAIGGIMITASHNPKEYNGYKIYDENGCQLVPHLADMVIDEINKIDDYFAIDTTKNHELIEYIDSNVDRSYRDTVNTIRINRDIDQDFKVVYTPLHGTGSVFASDVLKENGFKCYPLACQMTADPSFSGVKTSNPEDPRAFDEAIEYGKEIGASMVLATDPDADRLGMGIWHNGEYILLNGNQSATIMVHYICTNLKQQGRLPKDGWVFSTNVSSNLPLKIAESFGLKTYVSLTGFKFIGDQAERIEGKGTYVYGYEESYGCLVKDFVRDKDAIQAILMICEIAGWAKKHNMDLIDYLNQIYEEYGYTYESQSNIYLKGLDGKAKINAIMEHFRTTDLVLHFGDIVRKEDNKLQIAYDFLDGKIVTSTIELPTSNVLKYYFKNGSWFVLRPSGTEPKLKVYYGTFGKSMEEAKANNEKLKTEIMNLVNNL